MNLLFKNFRLTRFDAIALVSGVLLAFAFAPFHQPVFAFLSPALLLYTWSFCSPRQAARYGFIFGIGFFTNGVSWVFISIHVFGQAPIPLALLITFLFVGYLALFFAAQGYCLNKLCPDNNHYKFMLAFPSSLGYV